MDAALEDTIRFGQRRSWSCSAAREFVCIGTGTL